MNEFTPYSNQTMKLVSHRLRRAVRYMSPLLSRAERIHTLIDYVIQQGLQPWDFAGASGEDALIALAQALPTRVVVDTETTGLVPNTLVIDSLSREYKTVSKKMQIFAMYGGKPRKPPVVPSATFSATWKRVLQHALGQPE